MSSKIKKVRIIWTTFSNTIHSGKELVEVDSSKFNIGSYFNYSGTEESLVKKLNNDWPTLYHWLDFK